VFKEAVFRPCFKRSKSRLHRHTVSAVPCAAYLFRLVSSTEFSMHFSSLPAFHTFRLSLPHWILHSNNIYGLVQIMMLPVM
jgi:hypothetical protein